MLSTVEVSKILEVSPRVVQSWCKQGKINCVRVGGRYKIPEQSIYGMLTPETINKMEENKNG